MPFTCLFNEPKTFIEYWKISKSFCKLPSPVILWQCDDINTGEESWRGWMLGGGVKQTK
jgi:hypothetical protein